MKITIIIYDFKNYSKSNGWWTPHRNYNITMANNISSHSEWFDDQLTHIRIYRVSHSETADAVRINDLVFFLLHVKEKTRKLTNVVTLSLEKTSSIKGNTTAILNKQILELKYRFCEETQGITQTRASPLLGNATSVWTPSTQAGLLLGSQCIYCIYLSCILDCVDAVITLVWCLSPSLTLLAGNDAKIWAWQVPEGRLNTVTEPDLMLQDRTASTNGALLKSPEFFYL